MIKRIDVHNSTKDEYGHKHVPNDIYFTVVGIINIPTEEALFVVMEGMRKTAEIRLNKIKRHSP